MQAHMETLFNMIYLFTVIFLGTQMLLNSKGNMEVKLFGIMAVVLGLGDSFHLIPRSYALFTTGLEAHSASLGIGKLITSITMTVFYLLLFEFWKIRYKKNNQQILSYGIYGLAVLRIILCLFPQNQWLSFYPSVIWGIYRNIPFAIMGLLILYHFYQDAKASKDKAFRWMWLAITLSFGFYIPVVLWAKDLTWIGSLMIPKTLAYVWVVWMGYSMVKRPELLHPKTI